MIPKYLLNHSVTHYPKIGLDGSGREQYGEASAYKCRVQIQNRSRLTPEGKTITTEGIIYLNGNPAIENNDKISYQGINYKVYKKEVATEGNGDSHNTKLEIMKFTA